MYSWTVLLVTLLLDLSTAEDGASNEGTKFILGFICGYDDSNNDPEMRLIISSKAEKAVNVQISAPSINYLNTVTIASRSIQTVVLSTSICHFGTSVDSKAVYVTSQYNISLYGANVVINNDYIRTWGLELSFSDMFIIYPQDVLGTDYIVASWLSPVCCHSKLYIMIIATEDNTEINIKFPIRSQISFAFKGVMYSPGSVLNLTLNSLQTFVVQSVDFTGTQITSNYPTVVFSMAFFERIYEDSLPDNMIEQQMPTNYWGTDFVTVGIPNCNTPDIYRVISKEKNTYIEISGMESIELSESGDYETFTVTDNKPKFINSSKPVSLFFYSGKCTDIEGDSSMLMLPPLSNYGKEALFTTLLQYMRVDFSSYLSVIVHKSHKAGLILDDNPITTDWIDIDGNSEMHFAEIQISRGSHYLRHTDPSVTYLAAVTGRTMKTLDVGVTVSATFTFLAGLTFTEYSIKEKTFNESCSGNEQCKPTLFCISGICNCASSEHWNGNACVEGKKCDSTSDCNNTQTCISGVCQCTTLQYWTGTICAATFI